MKKRLILAGLGVMAILVGLAAFAANTAQWVNVQARVEKEIEVACVKKVPGSVPPKYEVDKNGCAFGVVFPENTHEKLVEVALSNSFKNQSLKSSVKYWVLWECKQYEPDRDVNKDGIPDCRVDAPKPHTLKYDATEGKWVHADQELDAGIRDYIDISTTVTCLKTPSSYAGRTDKHVQGVGDGLVSLANPKCLYDLIFTPPACKGHWNPITDPLPNPKEIDCHEVTTDPDPQKWDRFADMGDEFKIQVYDFGTEIP
jgi:hypothetical protein